MTGQQTKNEELRLLYQVTVGDLAYFKTQQWLVTNYSLLLFGALVAVAQFLKPSVNSGEKIGLGVLAGAVAFAALAVLWKLQKSIRVRQARLTATRAHFGPSFQRAWSAETKGDEYLHSIYFLYATVICACSLSIWLIGFRLLRNSLQC